MDSSNSRSKSITHFLYSGLGGHGNVFQSLINADTERSYLYKAVFFGIEPVRGEYVEFCTKRGIDYQFVCKKPGLDFFFFLNLFSIFLKDKSGIWFLHGSYLSLPAFVARLSRSTKIIVRETQANHLKTYKEWFQLKQAFRLADHVVVLSEAYKKELKLKWPRNSHVNECKVIPNGLNLQDYEMSKSNSEELVIGMISRIVRIKDHKTLIKAYSRVREEFPAVKLHIYGEGEMIEELKVLCKSLGFDSSDILKGVLSQQEIKSILPQLDIYAHCTFGETMSTSIMQAQACGLPIIASDVNGVNNVISHNENGILVPVENVEELESAINRLLKDSDRRSELSNASYKYAKERLSRDLMFSKYRELFD